MFTKPAIGTEETLSGHCPRPELSVTAREPKNPMKKFLAAKSDWLSRARLSRLVRAGLATPEENGSARTFVARNGE